MKNWKRRISLAVVLVLVLGVAGAAFLHKGVPAADVSMHDGGVWVTNDKLKLVAHLNYPSKTLDGGLRSTAESFDVSQSAGDVVLLGGAGASAQVINPAELTLGSTTALSKKLTFSQGGPLAVVVDSGAGKIWTMPIQDLSGFAPTLPPMAEGLPNVRATATTNGKVLAVTEDGEVLLFQRTDKEWKRSSLGSLKDLPSPKDRELTAVGEQLVVLDSASGTVHTLRGTAKVAPKSVPQQPGPAADAVVLAGTNELTFVPLNGGEPTIRRTSMPGTPGAPVRVGQCTYAIWGGSGAYQRVCTNHADDQTSTVQQVANKSAKPVFRVNRDVVVLNDVSNGNVFLVNDDMHLVANWEDISNSVQEKEQQDPTNSESVENSANPQRSEKNTPPKATPDDLGVRPGQSTVLPLVANDADADGDILTVASTSKVSVGSLTAARNGEAVSFTAPAGSTGSTDFTYVVSDGRGGTDTGQARVTIHPMTTNTAPREFRKNTVTVAQNATVRYNLLPDWIDPEGDSLMLQAAMPVDGLDIRTRPDGFISVTDLGTGPTGPREIPIVVSDGRMTTTGALRIVVKPKGNQNPLPIPDHVQVVQGQTAVVTPMLNDTDPNGDRLMLTSVSKAKPGQTIEMDANRGTFTFLSTEVGTSYVDYTVSDGPAAADSWVRVDVIPSTATQDPPVAETDIAVMPLNGVVLVEPLVNDYDPAGGVLVIQSVQVPRDALYSVEIIDRNRLRVSAPAGLDDQVSFGYTISNGVTSATGQVSVVPMPRDARLYPPIAQTDSAVVRAGDIVTVNVLDNDSSPNGFVLSVDERLVLDDPKAGIAFVSGDSLRFRANAGYEGTVRITYTVRDSQQNFASVDAVIQVKPLTEKNTSPQPLPVTARAIADSQIRIFVPLDGIDPNGDSVSLVGIAQAPTKGTATIGNGFITYTAPPGAKGTDIFTYTVADPFGATGTGTIAVGVAAPPSVNQAPVAVPDHIVSRPDRVVDVPVLLNDFDPDGDRLALQDGSVSPADRDTTAPAKVEGMTVQVNTPTQQGMLRYHYGITDGKGGTAQGTLTVEVTPTAPLRVPIARDDVMTIKDIKDGKVVVDVLDNDEDPDGTTSRLKVSSPDSVATIGQDNRITVPVIDRRQVVVYEITDVDGQVAKAAVVVPGLNEQRPMQIEGKSPVHVKSGEKLTIPLAEYVKVRDGRSPILTFEDKVKAGPGANGEPLVKDRTTMQFTSAKGFLGTTSITYEVTDGTSPDDPNGQKATLVLVIIVDPDGKHQPTATPSQVTVAAGEPAIEIDLKTMARDVDPGDMDKLAFSQGAVQGPFKVSVNRAGRLTVSTDSSTGPGTTGSVQVTVTDGSTDPITFTVPIVATASTRARMTTTPANLEGQAGKAITVDLTKYVTNPFADQGKPITVSGQPGITNGRGSVTVNGQSLVITPATGFHGQMIVTYTVLDATNQPSRAATGQVVVNVKDRPDPPTGVRAVSNASRSATVTWTSGANNGSPITDFIVSWTGGSKNCGAVTSCQITGLTNGTEYSFTVVAVNEVGKSDPSAASATVRPDTKPNKPLPPVCKPGDKKIDVTWTPPTNEGTAITAYNLVITGPGITSATSAKSVPGGTTAAAFTGLTNGGAYSVKVQAKNTSDMVSDFSEFSASCTPYGVPFAPTAVVASTAPATNLPPSITVNWKAPSSNGNPIQKYQVTNSAGQVVWTGAGTTAQFTTGISTADQTYTVKALNAAGWGPSSTASNAIRAFQAPSAVSGLKAAPTGANNSCTVTFGAAAGNGALPSEISYHWSANGQSGTIASGQTLTAFANGRDVTISVYALSTVKGATSQGPTVSTTCNAYGPPGAPSVSASSGINVVNFSWDASGTANGRPITQVQWTNDGINWNSSGLTGSKSVADYAITGSICIDVRASDGNAWGPITHKCATAQKPAPPTVQTPAPARKVSCSGYEKCNQYQLNLTGYRPYSTVRCTMGRTGTVLGNYSEDFTMDANGSSSKWGHLYSDYEFVMDWSGLRCTQL